MKQSTFNRRDFLTRVGLGALSIGALSMAACGKKEDAAGGGGGAAVACNDVSGLTDAEKATRVALKYVDATPEPNKRCDNCQHFVPPEGGAACGGCKLMKGPVAPGGYCTGWAAKAA